MWIKLAAVNPTFSSIGFNITAEDGRHFLFERTPEMIPDIVQLHVEDSDGMPAMFLVFNSIAAGQTRHLQFRVLARKQATAPQTLRLRLASAGFSLTPHPLGVRHDRTYFEFHVPEAFRLMPASKSPMLFMPKAAPVLPQGEGASSGN